MTVHKVIKKVVAESQIPGRFPSRIIFVRNFTDYLELVDELSKACDVVINLASYAQGDLIPDFRKLKRDLGTYTNKLILLLSMGEYLRLCGKRETNKVTSVFQGIWAAMQSEHATTKYIIPIFGGREAFDQAVTIVDSRQLDFLWDIESSKNPTEYQVKVYSPLFANVVSTDAASFQEWLENWNTWFAEREKKEFSLTSRLYKYARPQSGIVTVKVIDEPFEYVSTLTKDGSKLKREWGNEEFWADVAKFVRQGYSFSETVKAALNIGAHFDPTAILARFNDQLTGTARRLLWIWYKLYPFKDYYSFAIGKAEDPDDIPAKIRDAVFELPNASEITITQRTNALKSLLVSYREEYFLKLDKVLPMELRLSYLTYKTLEERAYAVKTVSSLLRSGAEINAVARQLRSGYPDLAEYLTGSEEDCSEISRYFKWYRKNKLINRPPVGWPNFIDYDSIDSRNKIIQQAGDPLVFWVDGLGVEWLPLLVNKLKRFPKVTIKSNVGRAILPTETEYNRKWKDIDEKWDRLDKLSHRGMPDDNDYYACIARQIDIIGEVADRVLELLSHHERLVITGDHGSSRLAALMFHVSENYAVMPPKNSIVRSFGRFCEMTGIVDIPLTSSMQQVELNDKKFIVMKTYEHFRQSGNAAGGNTEELAVSGEVHGGMTPEEFLVPVILVSHKDSHLKDKETKRAAILNEMGI